MDPIERTLSDLREPGLGILAVDEYADRAIKRRCLDAGVADALVRRALSPDLLGSSLAGVLLSPSRFAALPVDGDGPFDTAAVIGVRIDGFADNPGPVALATNARKRGARFVEVHANRTPAWQDPSLGHVAVEPIARTARAAQDVGVLPVIGVALHGLDDGSLGITRAVTVNGLRPTFAALAAAGVDPRRCALRLGLIGPGAVCDQQVTAAEVASATLDALAEVLPMNLGAVWFHSSGHDVATFADWLAATAALAVERGLSWHIGFAPGRAVVDAAAAAWSAAGPDRGYRAFHAACRTLSRSLEPALVHQ